MANTRLEITISYANKSGRKLYVNRIGNLWIDLKTGRGSIELPPGVALVNPGPDAWINVAIPKQFERREGGGNGGARGNDDPPDDDDQF